MMRSREESLFYCPLWTSRNPETFPNGGVCVLSRRSCYVDMKTNRRNDRGHETGREILDASMAGVSVGCGIHSHGKTESINLLFRCHAKLIYSRKYVAA